MAIPQISLYNHQPLGLHNWQHFSLQWRLVFMNTLLNLWLFLFKIWNLSAHSTKARMIFDLLENSFPSVAILLQELELTCWQECSKKWILFFYCGYLQLPLPEHCLYCPRFALDSMEIFSICCYLQLTLSNHSNYWLRSRMNCSHNEYSSLSFSVFSYLFPAIEIYFCI